MGQALYRKYRSKSLDEIVGQEHITKTLDRAIKTNRISHAYLFTGPRGVGKTSIARIMAHAINNLDYEDKVQQVDIIEIDAASNGGVEEVRDLREKVFVAPTSATYKVYIIDEVHMMSSGAFNALLKTLEEPPAHVVFILATTKPDKLPLTIISRTQHFQFKPIKKAQIVEHLSKIAELEDIKVEKDALALIAEHGSGSFRDSISLLDQAANYYQPVTVKGINELLGIPSQKLINTLVSSLGDTDSRVVLESLREMSEQGYSSPAIATALAKVLRDLFINNQLSIKVETTLNLLEKLIEVASSNDPDHFLEIILLRSLSLEQSSHTTTPKKPESDPEPIKLEPKAMALDEETTKPSTVVKEVDKNVNLTTKPKLTPKISNSPMNDELWKQVLDQLKTKHNTLYGLARMADVSFSEPNIINLKFAYSFHQKRLNEPKNREIIITAVKQISGLDLKLSCSIDPSLLETKNTSNKNDDDSHVSLKTINNVFGGGEIIN